MPATNRFLKRLMVGAALGFLVLAAPAARATLIYDLRLSGGGKSVAGLTVGQGLLLLLDLAAVVPDLRAGVADVQPAAVERVVEGCGLLLLVGDARVQARVHRRLAHRHAAHGGDAASRMPPPALQES